MYLIRPRRSTALHKIGIAIGIGIAIEGFIKYEPDFDKKAGHIPLERDDSPAYRNSLSVSQSASVY